MTAEGVPVTAVFELSTGLDGAQHPAVVFNAAAQQYFVTWDTLPSPSFPRITVFGRLVDADGTVAGSLVPIAPGGAPSLTINPQTHQYLIAWHDQGNIFARPVSASGSLLGVDVPIRTD